MRIGSRSSLVFLALLAYVACTTAVLSQAGAQSAEPLPVEDALRTLEFGQLTRIDASPDGKWLAYTVKNNQRSRTVDFDTWARSGVRDVFTGTDIQIFNLVTGVARNLTGGKDDNFMPAWSPDGHFLAFLSDRDGTGQLKLWMWDSIRNEMKKVCDLNIRQFGPVQWLPNSRQVVVAVIPENISADYYVKRLASGLGGQGANAAGVAPGSTVVVYHSRDAAGTKSESLKSDPWSLDIFLRDLVSIDVVTGKASTVVRGHRIANFLTSPDGSRLAYTSPLRFEKPGSQQVLFDFVTETISGAETKLLASGIRLNQDGGPFSWSPNGRYLVYRTYGTEESINDCYAVGTGGGTPRNVTAMVSPQQWPKSEPTWDAKGKEIYFISNGALWRAGIDGTKAVRVAQISGREITHLIHRSGDLLWTTSDARSTVVLTHDEERKQDGFYRIDLTTGQSAALLENGQCYSCANLLDPFVVTNWGRTVVYFAEDAQHDTDLWISDSSFKSPQRLTHLNPQFDKYKMGTARLIRWLSDDGQALQGALLLPAGYREGRHYPLIVWVYGGDSKSDDLSHFGLEGSGPLNMQLFATRGYAVLAPDSPQQLGTPMSDLVKTVLSGINKVIEMGIADPERLGVMGHSNGGYSTLALIVQTKRFKAAMEADGMADLTGQYGEMDNSGTAFGTSNLEHGQDALGGTPWEVRERYIENSPIFYLDRVQTPLLVIQGSSDRGVAPFLADEIFVDLRRLGKAVQYAKYQGEGHGLDYWSYANQTDFCDRTIAWFDRYLRNPAR